jgi:hypothetical protein
MQLYPDAKVLLSVRDPEKWYDSVANTIYRVSHLNPDHARTTHGHMVHPLIWQGTFGNRFEDKEYAIAVFLRHIQEVKQYVPAEKLLVYEVKEGWEPLCAFLGVAVPAGNHSPMTTTAPTSWATPYDNSNHNNSSPGRGKSHPYSGYLRHPF